MIIEKITVKGIQAHKKWFESQYRQDANDILVKGIWDKENTLRLYFYEDIDAVVIRGKDSLAKPEIPIGTLTTDQYVDGKNVYFDDIYWSIIFGKTCVFTNDAPIYELFMKGGKEIDYEQTEMNMVSKIAMKRILDSLDIPIELAPDADSFLLPSRDKFSCGFCRMTNRQEEVKFRYEAGWISYYINHELFQDILTLSEYNRDDSKDPEHGGIDGIENKYPNFDREDFILKWAEEIGNMIKDPLTEIKEIIFDNLSK
jgi:hypothetical protein